MTGQPILTYQPNPQWTIIADSGTVTVGQHFAADIVISR